MTIGLRIKDVADATGFTAATLRYYEQIGLLPAASRTPSGYRVYDQRTIDRLAFIARAKQLGCTLEEITALTVAWDGGDCGPVQDRLRGLVADKITAAQNQVAELMTFTAELQHAWAVLDRHRPVGPCDPDCGCVSDPMPTAAVTSTVLPVVLSAKPAAPGEAPIACTLCAPAMRGRAEEWRSLLAHVRRREPIDGGVRCVFAETVSYGELMRLVAAEQECCRFFAFTITLDRNGTTLEVRAPIDARPIVESLFGVVR